MAGLKNNPAIFIQGRSKTFTYSRKPKIKIALGLIQASSMKFRIK